MNKDAQADFVAICLNTLIHEKMDSESHCMTRETHLNVVFDVEQFQMPMLFVRPGGWWIARK
jgi:hypothetical protein